MRNYIIWNNQDSRNLHGLLISELPPITKPAMRTQITEIEEKDGDFIVDAIAKYFSDEGKVIFSNEPNKYYFAKITEQIDFERLIKFRTANVKFHIQPFKYLVNEEAVVFDIDVRQEVA